MSINFDNKDKMFNDIVNAISEAEDNNDENQDNEQSNGDTSNIEIAPPPEDAATKNSDTFIEGKVTNSYIENDPAIHNLIEIISEDMMDQDKIKGYVEVFFTRLGINDVDPEKFKIFSSEIWNKLEELTEVDPTAALAEFSSWSHDKIEQYSR
jgi:hypothetical protein